MPFLECNISERVDECGLTATLCPITFRTMFRTRFNIAVCDGSYWGQLYEDHTMLSSDFFKLSKAAD